MSTILITGLTENNNDILSSVIQYILQLNINEALDKKNFQ